MLRVFPASNKITKFHVDYQLRELIQQAEVLLEIAEDAVEFFCDENGVSGQRAWAMLHALSECKQDEFPDY